MRSTVIENYKLQLSLSQRQKEILVGMVLGDGHLEKVYHPEQARLKVEHSYKQKDYVDWLYAEFKDWVHQSPKQKVKKVWDKIHTNYGFCTYSHRLLGNFQREFYLNQKKIIPNSLSQYVTPLSLAVWFMDDGSIKSNKHKGIFLNTQSFTKSDVQKLQDILQIKIGITSTRKEVQGGEQIYLGGNSGEQFIKIIRPYIIPSLQYKIPKVLRLTELPKE